jgi:hypothetical protein
MNRIPNPAYMPIAQWAKEVYAALSVGKSGASEVEPTPVLLPSVTASDLPRATTPGVLLYDREYDALLVANGSAWAVHTSRAMHMTYQEPNGTDGVALGLTGTKVPYNAETVAVPVPWGALDLATGNVTLKRGVYLFSGFIVCAKATAGDRWVTAGVAASNDLTTPIGDAISGTLPLLAAGTADTSLQLTLHGVLAVPEGGGTYNVVVYIDGDAATMGAAHSEAGRANQYSLVTVTLLDIQDRT